MSKLWLLLLIVPAFFAFMRQIYKHYIFSPLVTFSCLCFCLIARSPAWYYLALGFVFSIIGDYLLAHVGSKEIRFVYGVGGFFLAHTCFCLYSLNNARMNIYLWIFAVVLALGYFMFMYLRILPKAEGLPLKIAITMYMLISVAALTLALSSSLPPYAKWTFVLGILFILFSDTLIGLKRFAGVKGIGKYILPTYYMCHILLAASTLY